MWTTRLIGQLDEADERAHKLVDGISEEQLNWQPAAGAWNIGQCLDHLCATSEAYLPPIALALDGKAKGSVQEITPGWFGRWFIQNVVEPSPKQKRFRAPKKITPGSRIEISVLDRFLGSNQAARELIDRARDFDVNHIRFANPFIPVIRFTIGTGFEIVTRHQRRHLMQAERVKSSAGFPG